MNEEYDYIVGFDFGHGETSVAKVDVAAIDTDSVHIDAEDLYIVGNDREPKIPSLVGYDKDGNIQLNFDAYQFKYLKVAAYFKAPMVASEKFQAITDENKQYFKDFVVTVFNKLHEHPRNQDLKNKKVLYFVACPSGWNKEQRTEYLNFFTDYCGLPVSGVIEESRAAHVVARRKLYEKNPDLCAYGKKIAVLDMGSSTLDITMHSDKTYSDGYEIGASMIEDVLLHYFLNTNDEFRAKYSQYEQMEPTCKNQILFILRMAKEDYFNKVSKRAAGDITLRCQVDWEELSNDEINGISNLKVRGSELMALLDANNGDDEKYINRLRSSVNKFIVRHGLVDAVVLTGGASLMPFYKEVVLDCYGLTEDECVVDRNPSYSISQGTAIMGYLDTKNPAKVPVGDPESLTRLLNQIPEIIKTQVLNCTINTYKTQLLSTVEQWNDLPGTKSLRNLYDQLSSLLASWEDHSSEISISTNREVAESVSQTVNDSLSEMMKLYFGFNMPLPSIHLDYDFRMTLSEEASLDFLKSVATKIREVIKKSKFLGRFKDPDDWEKDRSGNPRLCGKVAASLNHCISEFFEGYEIDMHDFETTTAECKDAVRRFYYECIRMITCQV